MPGSIDLFAGMDAALDAARRAAAAGEVPIGASLFLDDQLIASVANTCNAEANPLRHAELRLLDQAHARLSQPEFRRASLFVTLEPCPMCMGAILHSHLGRLVFGAYNLKWGSCGTVSDFTTLFPTEALDVVGGIREADCAALLADFFASLRA